MLLASSAGAEPSVEGQPRAEGRAAGPIEWSLAIHGGAGSIAPDMPAETRQAYVAGLQAALGAGRSILAAGGSALDAVEAAVRTLEEDPLFNAGRGAVFTYEGIHELDAAIMRGRDRAAGSVAGLRTVRSPIGLARLVMEKSPHVFLAGRGAEDFAAAMGAPLVEPHYFSTERRRSALEAFLQREQAASSPADHDTVGAVARDRTGSLAAATSTGGTTGKRWGRVGDVPVIGAGTFADDATVAVSATGTGELIIRAGLAHEVDALVRHAGLDAASAVRRVIGSMPAGSAGAVVVDGEGLFAWSFNTGGMFRAATDATGALEVAIWSEAENLGGQATAAPAGASDRIDGPTGEEDGR